MSSHDARPLLCSVAVLRGALAIVVLASGGCWNGEEALHKPCLNNDHCGRGQTCKDDFCDGPPSCNPPRPTTCDQVMMRAVVTSEVRNQSGGLSVAAASTELAGDAAADLVVLESYGVEVFENAGFDSWPLVAVDFSGVIAVSTSNLLASDLDVDGNAELLAGTVAGTVVIADWDGTTTSPLLTRDIQAGVPLYSLAAADLVGDAGREVVVVGDFGVQLMTNPMTTAELVRLDDGAVVNPRDVLVLGTGATARIIVPDSNEAKMSGERDQLVDVYAPDGERVARFGTNFENPWLLAEGDFLGGNEREIVVAERRVDLSSANTTQPGRLRFFRMEDDVVTEVSTPLDIGIGPVALAAGDLDCDGKTDLVIGYSPQSLQGDTPHVLFGSCETNASASDLVEVPGVGAFPSGNRLAVGDFDEDGRPEVAIPEARETSKGGVVIVDVEEAQ